MTTVFIVADVRIHRRGYHSLLAGEDGIEILGACSREDAPEHVRAKQPDVVLLDVTTGGHPTVINSILAYSPQAKVIAVGVEEDESAILTWIEHGACGYLTRRAAETDLLSAIADVTTGDLHCPPKVARKLLERVRELAGSNDGFGPAAPLTPREKEVAHLVAQGHSNKEIALTLSIEPSTVKNHVHNILQKAHVHRRAKAVARLE